MQMVQDALASMNDGGYGCCVCFFLFSGKGEGARMI